MGGSKCRKTGALLLTAALLVAAYLSTLPSCSASTIPHKKQRTSKTRAAPSPPPVDVGPRKPPAAPSPPPVDVGPRKPPAAPSPPPANVGPRKPPAAPSPPPVDVGPRKPPAAPSPPPVDVGPRKPPAAPSPPPVDVGPRKPSSFVFHMQGNVYPDGVYNVSMMIGEPPKPYFLDVDTGSDLTWLHCDAPCHQCPKCPHPLYRPDRNKVLLCSHPLCAALQKRRHPCKPNEQCHYEVDYADGSSSLGVLVADAFTFPLTAPGPARPQLAFGCGYDQEGPDFSRPSLTDGVLGLGRGRLSILSQLRDQGVTRGVAGHCLGSRGGGYLFFGDGPVPSSGVSWAPMSPVEPRSHYSLGPASLFLGHRSLGARALQVVLDSGSSYTYLEDQPYRAFLAAVKSDLLKAKLKPAPEDGTLAECWKGPTRFRSVVEVKKHLRPLVVSFKNGRDKQLKVPPENYLIISKFGNACLGILNGTEAGLKDLNVVGDVSLQDLMVIYDNEKQQIGWVRTSCDSGPESWISPLL